MACIFICLVFHNVFDHNVCVQVSTLKLKLLNTTKENISSKFGTQPVKKDTIQFGKTSIEELK